LQGTSTEQVVFHKPTWPEPSDQPSPRSLRKTGFKAACAVELVARPGSTRTAMTPEREVSGRPAASALCSRLLYARRRPRCSRLRTGRKAMTPEREVSGRPAASALYHRYWTGGGRRPDRIGCFSGTSHRRRDAEPCSTLAGSSGAEQRRDCGEYPQARRQPVRA
jgi:hypothetical protein